MGSIDKSFKIDGNNLSQVLNAVHNFAENQDRATKKALKATVGNAKTTAVALGAIQKGLRSQGEALNALQMKDLEADLEKISHAEQEANQKETSILHKKTLLDFFRRLFGKDPIKTANDKLNGVLTAVRRIPLRKIGFGFDPGEGFEPKVDKGYIRASNNKRDPEGTPLDNAKAEVNSLLNRGQVAEVTDAQLQTLQTEYKIHLMPKAKNIREVMERLQKAISEDPELQEAVDQYKVLKGTEQQDGSYRLEEQRDRNGERFPIIAIYAEGKEQAQKILNAVCKLFPEEEDLGEALPENMELMQQQMPRYNTRIDNLIYYAQGSADIKVKLPPELFDEGMVHFRGEGHRLENPRAHA